MQSKKIKQGGIVLAASLLVVDSVFAIDFGNVMNPSRWFGGNRDYYDNGYGYGYGPGYGGYPPPYGAPGYGVPGYGYPGAGYGAPAPAYTPPAYTAPVSSAQAPAAETDSQEIDQLRKRIQELEEASRQRAVSPGGQPAYQQAPSAPSYGNQQSYPTQMGGFVSQQAPQPAYDNSMQAPQPDYSSPQSQQPGFAGQTGYASPPVGARGNQWKYREDPSLPPVKDQ